MREFCFPSAFLQRFRAYLDSPEYANTEAHSKSEYWQHHSRLIKVEISNDRLTVSGSSGYYIPPLKKRSLVAVPGVAAGRSLLKKLYNRVFGPDMRHMGPAETFDAIMGLRPTAELEFGPQRVDLRKLTEDKRTVRSVRDMERMFFARDKYRLNSQVINAYYVWNILCLTRALDGVKTVLEIGAGSGNLSSLLAYHLKARVICVDIPETLCLSMPFIADLFPQAAILMPHEQPLPGVNYDFIFLTPRQIGRISDNSVDLALNTDSFQEMTASQIEEYFALIQRVTVKGGHFFTQNRVEKFLSDVEGMPEGEYVSRFYRYPWRKNETRILQSCPFMRLTQPDNAVIRLERIVK